MRGLKLLASVIGAQPDISTWSWATVTDDSPLRVQLDGESAALDVTPDTLVAPLAVNDRVWVQLVANANPSRRHRRLVVLGRAGCPFPIGHIYISASSTNPGTLFGGTWTAIQDRFLLAAGSTYTAGANGGAATHTLTVNELPSHAHDIALGHTADPANTRVASSTNDQGVKTGVVQSTGGGAAHNNMPPYLVVYVWKRTA